MNDVSNDRRTLLPGISAARVALACALAAGTGLIVVSTAATSDAATPHTYYVAPGGSDGAAGTQAGPWASFAHAESVAQAEDTVYFRGGTYTQHLRTAEHPQHHGHRPVHPERRRQPGARQRLARQLRPTQLGRR